MRLFGLVLACVGMDPVTDIPAAFSHAMEPAADQCGPGAHRATRHSQALLFLRPAGEKGSHGSLAIRPGVVLAKR